MKKDGKFSITINIGISTSFILLLVITSLALGSVVFLSVHKIIRYNLEQRIHDVVAVGSLSINGDEHNKILHSGQEGSREYIEIQDYLKKIQAGATEIRYAYTMRMNLKGEYLFIVQSDDDPIGELYDTPTATLKEAFAQQGRIYVEKEFSEDKWGTWVSGYAPFYDSNNNFAGILGVDVSARTIAEYERKSFSYILIFALIIGIIMVITSIIISKRITHPLEELENDMEKIQRLDFSKDLHIKTVFREIQSMNNTVNNMKAGLRSFAKYVPSDVVNQLILIHKEAVLSANKKEITVFFSDIADFTTISEKIEPEELVDSMSKYLGGMSRIIQENGGTIDKYIGDAIMSFWGAPRDMDDHAYKACQAALQCVEFLKSFNADLEKLGYSFHTRIGINTGEAVVGNIGSDNRLNYTAIGDNVNLASRLESLNKHFGTDIIISEFTYREIREVMLARKLDRVAVKGKTKDVYVYELVCDISSASEWQKGYVRMFNDAIELYFNQDWVEAATLFEKVLDIKPGDIPSALMIERCNNYKKKPPGDGWFQ
ncbi:MAG: adenylate/guanylate cyclase domain-containing protein [Bacillota bacterium]